MFVDKEMVEEAIERLWRDVPVGNGRDLNILVTYIEKLEGRSKYCENSVHLWA